MDRHTLQIHAMDEQQKTDFFSLYGDLLMEPMEIDLLPSRPVEHRREQPHQTIVSTRVLSNPHQNYMQLKGILRTLEEYDIFTEEWREDQKHVVEDYAELMTFIKSSEKMKTERYRKLVEDMEDALDQVIDCILKYDNIEINFYTEFVKGMIKVYECELDVDILCDQMSNL